jgi:hypothetical protein
MAKNPAKNPSQKPPKIHGKNLLKTPCGQKSSKGYQKSFVKTLT